MRYAGCAVFVAALSAGVPGAWAAGGANRLALTQAQCAQPPPGHPGPCSPSFTFARGTAILKGSIKEPIPTCPKTHMPEEAKAGAASLVQVKKNGTPFTGRLPMMMFLKTTFGADPGGALCVLAQTQLTVASLMGSLECRSGKCRGSLFPVACLPGSCADTPIVSELASVTLADPRFAGQTFGPFIVLDDDQNPLATAGTVLTPARADVP